MDLLSTFALYTFYILGALQDTDGAHHVKEITRWDYHGNLGPEHWCKIFQNESSDCCGSEQSPISIDTSDVTVVTNHVLHVKGLDTNDGIFSLCNNGHTVQVTVNVASKTSEELRQNPRPQLLVADGNKSDWSIKSPKVYIMDTIHFHFGSKSNRGSEHTIDGATFPMEIHLVFYWNKYTSVGEVIRVKGGLAVVAIQTELSTFNNPSLASLIHELPNVAYPEHPTLLPDFTLRDLMPKHTRNYYFYTGSLTTPHCNEGVSWHIYKRRIPISEIQLSAFRTLTKPDIVTTYYNGWNYLSDNFRPLQHLNKRKVYENRPKSSSPELSDRKTPAWTQIFSLKIKYQANLNTLLPIKNVTDNYLNETKSVRFSTNHIAIGNFLP